MGNEHFYEELCKECDSIIQKSRHSFQDIERFNELCKAKKNLEYTQQGHSQTYSQQGNSYNNSYMNSNNSMGGSYANMSNSNRSYMSNHSIIDRLISATEGLMDQAGSDYERNILQTWIHKMREGEYREGR